MPKIVMIDDDKSLLGLTEEFLLSQGWGFAGAATGKSGLKLVSREKPDLIVLDVNLPDTDGFAVASKLRKAPATRDIPIVFISGDKKTAEDVIEGLDGRKADAYLLKPVHLLVLKSKLEAVLKSFEGK